MPTDREQWEACADPVWMLYLFFSRRELTAFDRFTRWLSRLGDLGRSRPRGIWHPPYRLWDRALELFDCACGHRLWPSLHDACRAYLKAKERYAEGQTSREEMNELLPAASRALPALARALDPGPFTETMHVLGLHFAGLLLGDPGRRPDEGATQARLFREIFGYPFRTAPHMDPAWLTWNNDTPGRLARGIYEERAFDCLPLLADALEDAGCTDGEILDHFRRGGEHVRGCWALDLVLRKG